MPQYNITKIEVRKIAKGQYQKTGKAFIYKDKVGEGVLAPLKIRCPGCFHYFHTPSDLGGHKVGCKSYNALMEGKKNRR